MEKKDNTKKQPSNINWLKVMLVLLLAALAVEAVLIIKNHKKSSNAIAQQTLPTEEVSVPSNDMDIDDISAPGEDEEPISYEDDDIVGKLDKGSSTKSDDSHPAKTEDKKPKIKIKIPEPDVNSPSQDDVVSDDKDVKSPEPDDKALQREDHAPEVTKANRPFEPRGNFRKYKPPFNR